MKTLEKSIEYSVKKKEHQISKLENSFFNEPLKELSDYLTDVESRSSVGLNFDYLTTWTHWNFINELLANNRLDYERLAVSTFYAQESNNWRFYIGESSSTYGKAVPLTLSIKHLAQLLYLGQKRRAVAYGNLLLKMLYGKQYDGGNSFPTHPWFMLDLFSRWQGKKLEQKGTRHPDDLGVYQKAIDHWDTEDTALLSSIVDTLSDFHTLQSSEDVTTDEHGNEFSPEFTSADYFIFPVEILMWLAIRKDLGLPAYTPSADNKLMQMELNRLPETPIPEFKDALVEKCKEKLKKDNPGIEFEL